MGMFFFIFSSFRQLRYSMRIFWFCKGRADFFKVFKRKLDLAADTAITKIPPSHMANNISPMTDGVLLLTDSAKSFICFAVPGTFIFNAVSAAAPMPGAPAFFKLSSHKKICENLIGRTGRNGTISIPSNRSHKWSCIRLVRYLFKAYFARKSMLIMTQIKILQRKKRIPKSAMLVSPILCFFEKK